MSETGGIQRLTANEANTGQSVKTSAGYANRTANTQLEVDYYINNVKPSEGTPSVRVHPSCEIKTGDTIAVVNELNTRILAIIGRRCTTCPLVQHCQNAQNAELLTRPFPPEGKQAKYLLQRAGVNLAEFHVHFRNDPDPFSMHHISNLYDPNLEGGNRVSLDDLWNIGLNAVLEDEAIVINEQGQTLWEDINSGDLRTYTGDDPYNNDI